MILQALYGYYRLLSQDNRFGVAQQGIAPQTVGFALELFEDGALAGVFDLREKNDKGKLVGRTMLLPSRGQKRTVGIAPNFLWDNPTYVLGRDDKGKPERSVKCQQAFYALHEKLLGQADSKEAKALLKFLANPEADHPKIEEYWKDMAKSNLVFRLHGQTRFLHEALGGYWTSENEEEGGPTRVCLVTGEKGPIARLHPGVKGIAGGQVAEMSLCSYNKEAFCSFGQEQNMNGPVGAKAAFGYATALNYLLSQPEQHISLGETTVVVWAERTSVLEKKMLFLLHSQPPGTKTANPAAAQGRVNVLRKLAQRLPLTETWPELDPNVEMHVLGLAPNSARLSVSFFLTGSAAWFLEKIRGWYADLAIARRFDWEEEFPSLYAVAKAALGNHKKPKDVKRLSDDLFKSALAGGLYPDYLLPMCLDRLRAGDELTSTHAALIKASLIRNFHKEVDMSLNKDHPSVAYQLGRLFALLAALQRRAISNDINAGIKEKYFGSASATPSLVFPQLIRNAQNHISKAKAGGYDILIGEVLNKIDNAFPKHLSLEEQGLFALGYYHQMADRKADDTTNDTATQGEDNGNDR